VITDDNCMCTGKSGDEPRTACSNGGVARNLDPVHTMMQARSQIFDMRIYLLTSSLRLRTVIAMVNVLQMSTLYSD